MFVRKTACAALIAAGLITSAQSAKCEDNEAASAIAVQTSTPAAPKPLLSRWIDITEMSESQRFRRNYDENGADLFANGQQRTALAGRFMFDKEARYFVGFRAESGRFFNWGYANYIGHDFSYYAGLSVGKFTPAEFSNFFAAIYADPQGLSTYPARGWNFYMRDLYVSATPVKQVTFQVGSIPIERGYSTEITSFDDDGYIEGERVRLTDPKHLFVDEIAFTNAYLGDIGIPNYFARGYRMGHTSNYRQLTAKKLLTKKIGVSGEYNWLGGTHTLREAVLVPTPEFKLVDSVRGELYQRLNDFALQGMPIPHASGFSVAAAKKVGRLSGDAGYADVDSNYGSYTGSRFLTVVGFSLNGDTYNTGKRFYSHASLRLTNGVSMFGFYTHVVAGDDYTYNKQGLNAGLKFDLKALVNSGRQIF